MSKSFFFLFLLFSAGFLGFWFGKGGPPLLLVGSAPAEKEFVIVLHCNGEQEEAISSLQTCLNQQYEAFEVYVIDDSTEEKDYEQLKIFCNEHSLKDKLKFFHVDEPLGLTGALVFVSSQLKGSEILIPMQAKDLLGHVAVLKRLNLVYTQKPDVWLTLTHPILLPDYEMHRTFQKISTAISPSTPMSFYAALFKKIALGDLVKEGQYCKYSYFSPLVQLSTKHRAIFDEPLFLTSCQEECLNLERYNYASLDAFPEKNPEMGVDFLIFSCNRPLQLYACLESISRYFTGYEKISVLCRADDEKYRQSYQIVEEAFPHVQFIYQSENPKRDFKNLTLEQLSHFSSAYIAFGVDDQIVTDFVDLRECAKKLEETSSYGFYLRFGKEICYSYQGGKEQMVPKSIYLGNGVYGWNLKQGCTDWDFPHTLDMAIYRKKDIEKNFRKMHYKTPNSLEFSWAKQTCPERAIGLYFEHAKVVNVPLNVVGRTGNPHMNAYTVEELLEFFKEGLKIDITPLYQIANLSPHIEYNPTFINRESL